MTRTVTAPGIYDDMPASEYHADPVPGGSLSSSGARQLLPPSCPAKYRWSREHPQPHKQVFDLGHAAHAAILGVGEPVEVLDEKFANYNTKAAQQARDEAYAAGKTPLLVKERDQVAAMEAALRAHPIAGPLFEPGTFAAEQCLFWFDDEFGVWRRAMLDAHTRLDDGRLLIVDYKTTRSAEPEQVAKSIADYGYHQQDPWYCDAAVATGLADSLDDVAFVFVFQEKDPPHLITVTEVQPNDRSWGRLDNRRALRIFADCQATGLWPGYADDVIPVGLPTWTTRLKEQAYDRGVYNAALPKDIPA